jgi:RNA polymerase sigma-70 factor (ECF subfamily)
MLYDTHVDAVGRYATRRVSSSDVQDVVADTFTIAWQKLDALPEDALPWLFATARNQISNRVRTAGRHRLRTIEPAQTHEDPATTFEESQLDERIADAINRLTPTERDAFMLIAWDGLSPVRAARAAGCSAVALRVRFHRARRKLAQSINAPSLSYGAVRDTHQLKEEAS